MVFVKFNKSLKKFKFSFYNFTTSEIQFISSLRTTKIITQTNMERKHIHSVFAIICLFQAKINLCHFLLFIVSQTCVSNKRFPVHQLFDIKL